MKRPFNLRALTLVSRLAGKGENFLTEVLPFVCSQVHVASQQSAGLQVAAGGVKEFKQRRHGGRDTHPGCVTLQRCARFPPQFVTLRILISSAQQLLTFRDLLPGVSDGEAPTFGHV